MADSTLLGLPAATVFDGTEQFYVVQSSTDKKMLGELIARRILAADLTLYVSTTGNDVTGDGSSGNKWATLAHAFEEVEEHIDPNGFTITIQLQAGTVGTPAVYAGTDTPSISGYGYCFVETSDGNPLTTQIGDGTTSNVIFAYNPTYVEFWFGGMTIKANGVCLIMQGEVFVGFGTINCPNINLNSLGSNPNAVIILNQHSRFSDAGFGATPNISLTVAAGRGGYISVGPRCEAELFATYTIVGTPTWNVAFFYVFNRGKMTTNLRVGVNVTGASIGPRFSASDFANIDQQAGALEDLPGNANPITSNNALYKGRFRELLLGGGAAGEFTTTLRNGATVANRIYILPTDFGQPGGVLCDPAGNGTLDWRLPVSTVSALPAASAANARIRRFVSDANANTFASIVASGGSNFVPVYSDGTNWRIG